MSDVKVDVFLSPAPGPNDKNLVKFLSEITQESGINATVVFHEEPNELLEEYNITSKPAIVIDGMIKIMGFCPSRESILYAIRGGALE
jgi:hypothetical protein